MAIGQMGIFGLSLHLYYTGHNYIGHNYIGHNYVGHNYIGRNYTGILGLSLHLCASGVITAEAMTT